MSFILSLITTIVFTLIIPTAIQHTTENNSSSLLHYDYCNINDSKTVYYIIQDLISYFNINPTNNKCLLVDNVFTEYTNNFISLDNSLMKGTQIIKCPFCNKKFRSKNLLNMHYKLFHLSNNSTTTTNNICLGDYCKGLNCDRYKKFFDIKYLDNTRETFMYNRQPIERIQFCNKDLIPFYKNMCMKMIDGCFNDDNDKVFMYYQYICNRIDCDITYDKQLTKEGAFSGLLRIIFMYIVSVLCIIYLILIWLNKYT